MKAEVVRLLKSYVLSAASRQITPLVRTCLELSLHDEAKQNLAPLREELQHRSRFNPKAPVNSLDDIEERLLTCRIFCNTPDHKPLIEEAQSLMQSLRSSNLFSSVEKHRFAELGTQLENEIKFGSKLE